MQFSTIILALAATASAQYAVTNGTSTTLSTVAPYPSSASGAAATAPYPTASGTVSVAPSGTGSVKPTSSSTAPFEGAGNRLTGSALGLVIAGGVALML